RRWRPVGAYRSRKRFHASAGPVAWRTGACNRPTMVVTKMRYAALTLSSHTERAVAYSSSVWSAAGASVVESAVSTAVETGTRRTGELSIPETRPHSFSFKN